MPPRFSGLRMELEASDFLDPSDTWSFTLVLVDIVLIMWLWIMYTFLLNFKIHMLITYS